MSPIQSAIQVQSALSSIGSPPVEKSSFNNKGNATTVEGEDTDELVTGVGSTLLYGAAAIAFGTAAYSMFMTASIIVDFACVTIFVLAPVAIAQKQKLAKLGSMRRQQNDLRHTVNNLSAENKNLSDNIAEMENVVQDFKSVENDLQSIAKKSGGQVDRLLNIIEEKAELQAKIKQNLEAQVMQNVLRTVLQADSNMDFTLDQKEIQRLKHKLANIPGITFDKDNFDEKIGNKNLTLVEIMTMFRNLKADIPEPDNIFHLTPEKMVKRGFFG